MSQASAMQEDAMARRKNFKKELEKRRAIAATLLLEEPGSAVLKTAKGFVDGLAPGYRRAIADYIGWLDDDMLGTETAFRVGPMDYCPVTEREHIADWHRERRGVITRLSMWGWNPYRSPKPSGAQRERGRERVASERQPEL
jgi:hypothetical protein